MQHNGKINLSQFEGAYLKVIGAACRPAQYGYPTLNALLQAIPCTVVIETNRQKRKVVSINRKLSGNDRNFINLHTLFSLNCVFKKNTLNKSAAQQSLLKISFFQYK